MPFNIRNIRAKQLLTLATPFEVRFSSGWKKVAKVVGKHDPDRPDMPKVGLYDSTERLIAWFYMSTEVRVREREG